MAYSLDNIHSYSSHYTPFESGSKICLHRLWPILPTPCWTISHGFTISNWESMCLKVNPQAQANLRLLLISCLNKYHLCPLQFFMLEIWDIAWLLTFSHTSLKSITNKFSLIVSLISLKSIHLFMSIFQLPSLSLFKNLFSFLFFFFSFFYL